VGICPEESRVDYIRDNIHPDTISVLEIVGVTNGTGIDLESYLVTRRPEGDL
jgi:hypothetical protein